MYQNPQFGNTNTIDYAELKPNVIVRSGRPNEGQAALGFSEDGGKTWQAADEGLPDQSVSLIAIPRERPSTVYAMTSVFGELFKTDDEGNCFPGRCP